MLSLLNTTFTNAVTKGFSLVSSLLNKLKKRVSDDGGTFENEACTKAELEKLNKKGLLSKVTVLTTPTAYNFRKLYSIKPEGLGDELVTNGDFATDLSGWFLQNVDESNTITWETNGARIISVGVNISLRQLNILEVGKTYKLTCDLDITSGTLGIDSSTAGSTINMVEGFNEIIFTANNSRLTIKRITGNDNCLIDNISVKEVLNADFETDRGSLATRVNEQGYIDATLANADPRIDYLSGCGSFLLEPSRTNLQVNSEEFDNTLWNKVRASITPNDTTSPSGLLNADTLEGLSGSTSYLFDGVNVVSGSVYTISFFVKYIDISEFVIANFTQSGNAYFNIENGTVISNSGTVTEPKIENYGNGWYRCSVKFTANATQAVAYGPFLNNATNKSLHIWGAQFELGSYPTSYIPTTTAAVTRNAESANDAGSPTLFNDSEGVLMVEIKKFEEIPTSSQYIQITDGVASFTNAVLLQFRNNGDLRIYMGGSASANIQFIVPDINFTENNKIAIQYDSNGSNYKLFVNGVSKARYSLATNQSVAGLSHIDLNYVFTNSRAFGNTKQIQYYNSALTDSELEALTSWVSFSDMANGQSYTIE